MIKDWIIQFSSVQRKKYLENMKQLLILCIFLSLFINASAVKYVVPKDVEFTLEYERYMNEVAEVLQKDEEFKSQLAKTSKSELTSGDISKHLKIVSLEVRSKLNELKRIELDRLRMLYKRKERREARTGGANKRDFRMKFDSPNMVGHLDHHNPDFFGQKDLEFLIKKAVIDLEVIDEKREEEFKKYEMEKELLRRKEMEQLDEEKRTEEQHKFEEAQKKHKDHPKLHQPGHKAQLEEVWDADHEDQEFNPKTFFIEHDLDGNGFLDEAEIEPIFLIEVEKMYNDSAPEDDMNEKFEELYRMRIQLVNEYDTNKDKLISMDEVLAFVNKQEFKKDEGWKGLDEEEIFSEDDFLNFEKEYDAAHADDKPKL